MQASTRSTYRSMLDARILPAFGERELSSITPVDLSRFIAKIKTSPRHRLNLYSLLRTIFRVAFEHDLITTSPVREIHRPAYTREPKPVLTPEQIHKLMLEIPAPYRLLFTLIALTGIRISEALALCWEDFNPQTSTLQIAYALYHKQRKAPKTRSTVRPLHLPPPLVSALADHQRAARFGSPTDFIFRHADGEPFEQSTLRRHVLHPAMDRVGIPRARFTHGFHLFRHSAGTNLYLLKRDLQLVKDHLGHASIQTTSDIYLHTEHATTTDTTSTLAEVIKLERLLESSLVN